MFLFLSLTKDIFLSVLKACKIITQDTSRNLTKPGKKYNKNLTIRCLDILTIRFHCDRRSYIYFYISERSQFERKIQDRLLSNVQKYKYQKIWKVEKSGLQRSFCTGHNLTWPPMDTILLNALVSLVKNSYRSPWLRLRVLWCGVSSDIFSLAVVGD